MSELDKIDKTQPKYRTDFFNVTNFGTIYEVREHFISMPKLD